MQKHLGKYKRFFHKVKSENVWVSNSLTLIESAEKWFCCILYNVHWNTNECFFQPHWMIPGCSHQYNTCSIASISLSAQNSKIRKIMVYLSSHEFFWPTHLCFNLEKYYSLESTNQQVNFHCMSSFSTARVFQTSFHLLKICFWFCYLCHYSSKWHRHHFPSSHSDHWDNLFVFFLCRKCNKSNPCQKQGLNFRSWNLHFMLCCLFTEAIQSAKTNNATWLV